MNNSKQSEMIRATLENAKSLFCADLVCGKAIETKNGTVIIPVSKLSVGVASGGLDYLSRLSNEEKNFGGGGGTGINIVPLGFLIVNDLGHVELLPLEAPSRDTASYIFDFISSSPDLFEKFKTIFNK